MLAPHEVSTIQLTLSLGWIHRILFLRIHGLRICESVKTNVCDIRTKKMYAKKCKVSHKSTLLPSLCFSTPQCTRVCVCLKLRLCSTIGTDRPLVISSWRIDDLGRTEWVWSVHFISVSVRVFMTSAGELTETVLFISFQFSTGISSSEPWARRIEWESIQHDHTYFVSEMTHLIRTNTTVMTQQNIFTQICTRCTYDRAGLFV